MDRQPVNHLPKITLFMKKLILSSILIALLACIILPYKAEATLCVWLPLIEECGHDTNAPLCAVSEPNCDPVVVKPD